MKDFTYETSFKNIFAEYTIVISTDFQSYGCKNPIIMDKNSVY